jgi:hypothetical protein
MSPCWSHSCRPTSSAPTWRGPRGGVFDEVIPHLIVVDCGARVPCDESTAVMDSAERAIVGGMPIRAQAHEIWLMVGDGRWTLRARFPLGG